MRGWLAKIVVVVATLAQHCSRTQGCAASPLQDFWLVGTGQCVDTAGNSTSGYVCPTAPCPVAQDADSCGLLCELDDGCTGFELRTAAIPNTTTPALHCFLFVVAPVEDTHHPTEPWPWVKVNGTQPLNGRVVVKADGNPASCCYKRAYPRPNPSANPVKMPPVQSKLQQEIFANLTAEAKEASATATPALMELIDFCAANATLSGRPYHMFNATYCPGLADLTAPGQEYPTSAQIIQRFSEEVCCFRRRCSTLAGIGCFCIVSTTGKCFLEDKRSPPRCVCFCVGQVRAAEYGHGYDVLSPLMNPLDNFNPSYPYVLVRQKLLCGALAINAFCLFIFVCFAEGSCSTYTTPVPSESIPPTPMVTVRGVYF